LCQKGGPHRRGPRDIWQCDATGRYSGFPPSEPSADVVSADIAPRAEYVPDQSFLRGRQTAGAAGMIEFRTINPGLGSRVSFACMSANLRMYIASLFELEHAMRRAPMNRWDNSSPCEGWTAREVAGHAIAVIEHIPARLAGKAGHDPFSDLAAHAGVHPQATCRSARVAAMVALDSPRVLSTTVTTSMGTMTMDAYLVPLARDAAIHAWDIARATETDERLDPGLVDATLDLLSPTEMAAGRGTYARPVEMDAGASPQQRLLAAVGRNPLPVV
jgi:uncharacterized protein (TIGR03086 family)